MDRPTLQDCRLLHAFRQLRRDVFHGVDGNIDRMVQ